MSVWDHKKIQILKENWGSLSASALAEKIGGVSRNAVIGKAFRLNLSAKFSGNKSFNNSRTKKIESKNEVRRKSIGIKRGKFRSLLIEKDFEPENPKQLEELDEKTCKWPIGHPNEKSFYFCGRSSLKDFSYCKLHLLYAYQPKGKKEDVDDKKEEVPEFIEKKISSA